MTKSADLIAYFSKKTRLPVDLNEVKDWLLQRSYQDEINFLPSDLDTGVIRGFLKRVRRKYGWDIETRDISNIYYDQSQGADWINLVVAKELIHILDAARCSTKEEYEKLRKSLALPNDLKNMLSSPDFALMDKLGSIPAAAILLPLAARELLLPAYEAKVLTDEIIAELAVIPIQHVRSVMSSDWPDVHAILVNGATDDTHDDDSSSTDA